MLSTSSHLNDYLNHGYTSVDNQNNIFRTKAKFSFWKKVISVSPRQATTMLQTAFPQLLFSVKAKEYRTNEYQNVVLRGYLTRSTEGAEIVTPHNIILHSSYGIPIPVLSFEERRDFIRWTQVLAYHNEPQMIPPTMNAAFIKGLNNWTRIRNEIKKQTDAIPESVEWQKVFQSIIKNKNQYQDALILLLCNQPYSNLTSESLSLDQSSWLKKSATIRLEHEFVHWYCFCQFGQVTKHLFDELIADYIGIVKAFGDYQSSTFLKFMGLDGENININENRWRNYIPCDLFTRGEIDSILETAIQASRTLQSFHEHIKDCFSTTIPITLQTLFQLNLSLLASPHAHENLILEFEKNRSLVKNITVNKNE